MLVWVRVRVRGCVGGYSRFMARWRWKNQSGTLGWWIEAIDLCWRGTASKEKHEHAERKMCCLPEGCSSASAYGAHIANVTPHRERVTERKRHTQRESCSV